MPTKNEIVWTIIGYGVSHTHEPYLDQLLDRVIKDIRMTNSDFGLIKVEGRTFNFSDLQAHYIIDFMRQMTEEEGNQTGWNLIQSGCRAELLGRVSHEYRNRASEKSRLSS